MVENNNLISIACGGFFCSFSKKVAVLGRYSIYNVEYIRRIPCNRMHIMPLQDGPGRISARLA